MKNVQDAIVLSPVASTMWVLIGIVLSLILPVAVKVLLRAKLEGIEKPTFRQRVSAAWMKYGGNKYLTIALAASLVAIVIVFLLGMEFFRIRDAVLAGFAWESLLNKLLSGSTS
jgi:hypothetical protein